MMIPGRPSMQFHSSIGLKWTPIAGIARFAAVEAD
jgi:hypothetical protein